MNRAVLAVLAFMCIAMVVITFRARHRTVPERSLLLWPWYWRSTYGTGAAIAAAIYAAGAIALVVFAVTGIGSG